MNERAIVQSKTKDGQCNPVSRTEQPYWGLIYVSNYLIIDTGLSVLSSNNEEIYCFVKHRSLIDRENVVRFQGTTVRFPRARELPSQNLTEPIILEKLNKPRGSLRPFLSPDCGVRCGSISLGCLGRDGSKPSVPKTNKFFILLYYPRYNLLMVEQPAFAEGDGQGRGRTRHP